MKRIIIFILLCIVFLSGCNREVSFEKPEILKGKICEDSKIVQVGVNFNNGSIVDIAITEIVGFDDDAREMAERVAYEIVSKQSLSVDLIAGATEISRYMIDAVSAALKSGGISVKLFKENLTPTKKVYRDKNKFDVIVIGSGAAGLSAALQSALNGDEVLVLEKMPIAGGSTYMSGAEIAIPENIFAVNTPQTDNPEKMIEDILKTSLNTADKKLVSTICYNIADTVLWLKENIGIEFNNDYYMVNGHSIARITFPDGGGPSLINHMLRSSESLGVQILYNTAAKRLIQNDQGEITGVEVHKEEDLLRFYAAHRVVIATGGFSANKSMCEIYNVKLKKLNILSSGPQGNVGDGIVMGREVGAAVIDMENVQLYPYTNPATGIHFYMDNKRIDAGALYINKEGKRFVREDLTRKIVSAAVLEQTESTMYEVFTEEILNKFCVNDLALKEFNQWVYQGVIAKGDTIGDCAEEFAIDRDEVSKTLRRYNFLIKNGLDEDYGREMDFPPLDKGPYYMLEGVPSIHNTLGGLKIDGHARVLDKHDIPIPHLYAAGEVTGGIFGKDRLGACAIPDALVFGRIAGGYKAE